MFLPLLSAGILYTDNNGKSSDEAGPPIDSVYTKQPSSAIVQAYARHPTRSSAAVS